VAMVRFTCSCVSSDMSAASSAVCAAGSNPSSPIRLTSSGSATLLDAGGTDDMPLELLSGLGDGCCCCCCEAGTAAVLEYSLRSR